MLNIDYKIIAEPEKTLDKKEKTIWNHNASTQL